MHMEIYIYVCIYAHVYICIHTVTSVFAVADCDALVWMPDMVLPLLLRLIPSTRRLLMALLRYGVATISRLLKIIGLF